MRLTYSCLLCCQPVAGSSHPGTGHSLHFERCCSDSHLLDILETLGKSPRGILKWDWARTPYSEWCFLKIIYLEFTKESWVSLREAGKLQPVVKQARVYEELKNRVCRERWWKGSVIFWAPAVQGVLYGGRRAQDCWGWNPMVSGGFSGITDGNRVKG